MPQGHLARSLSGTCLGAQGATSPSALTLGTRENPRAQGGVCKTGGGHAVPTVQGAALPPAMAPGTMSTAGGCREVAGARRWYEGNVTYARRAGWLMQCWHCPRATCQVPTDVTSHMYRLRRGQLSPAVSRLLQTESAVMPGAWECCRACRAEDCICYLPALNCTGLHLCQPHLSCQSLNVPGRPCQHAAEQHQIHLMEMPSRWSAKHVAHALHGLACCSGNP